MSEPSKKKYISEGALLIVTIFWGATFAVIKSALPDISSMLFIAFRFSIAAIILLPFTIPKLRYADRESLKSGAVLGTIMFLGFATQTIGLKFTSATKSGFLTGTAVIMIPFLQLLIEKKWPGKGTWAGTVLVLIGILFLASGGESVFSFIQDLGGNFNIGDFFTLLCAVSFAFYVIYLDIYSKKIDFIILLFMQIFMCALWGFVTSFLFAGLLLEPVRVQVTLNLVMALAYTAIIATLVTTALQTKYQKGVTPAQAGIIYSFEPIFAAIAAFFLLNEKLTNFGLIGCLLIFLGLVISESFDTIKERFIERKSQS
jgi:drug/metabolite transporter (DMT)-like permease